MDIKKFNGVLNSFARNVVKDAKKTAKKKEWALATKLKYKVETGKNSFTIQFTPGYAKWVDEGVSGVDNKIAGAPNSFKRKGGKGSFKGMPPSSAMDKWNVKRGIKIRDEETGRFLPRKSANFAIAVSVWKKGIKRSLFFTKPFKKYYKTLPIELLDAFDLEVQELLKHTFIDGINEDYKKAAKRAAKFN